MGTVVLVVVGVVVVAAIGFLLYAERGRLCLPSTLRLARLGGLRRLLNLSGLHAYVYGRWTAPYVKRLIERIVPRLDREGKQRLADRYHGKVLTPEHARAVVTLDRPVPLQDLEQIVPYATARDLVLKGSPDVAAYECACRGARSEACEPSMVCMVVGQPFVDFMLEHHPASSRRLTQPEALELLEAEHKRGHVHSAWFKDALLGRFYAICNCCRCCCAGIEAMVKHEVPMMAPSGYVAQVAAGTCVACGACAEVCPFGAITVDEVASVDRAKCMGCGVCIDRCRPGALSLVRDETRGVPLDVRALADGTGVAARVSG
jgi:ferredoxin